MKEQNVLEISWDTLFKILVAGIIFYFLFQIKDLIMWVVFAYVISLLFNPIINFFNTKLKVPRALATVFVYLLFFSIIGLTIYLTIPVISKEIQQFFDLFPTYFEQLSPILRDLGVKSFEKVENYNESMQFLLNEASENIPNILSFFFGSLFKAIFTISAAFFLSLDAKKVRNGISLLFPEEQEPQVASILKRVQKKVSRWFGGALVSASFVGLVTVGVLLLFGVKYAWLFGLLAGILGFIPFVGPTVVSVLAFAIVAIDSLPRAVMIVIAFLIIQQVEGNLVTPAISKKFVGIPPFLVIFSVVLGGVLFGFPGVVIAIPLTGIIQEFLVEYLKMKRKQGKEIKEADV